MADYAGGTGTALDPYQISNFDQFIMSDSHVAGDHLVLINDIDCGDTNLCDWIGNRGINLKPGAVYDGQGYRIKNFYINRTATSGNVGLFYCASGGAAPTIKRIQAETNYKGITVVPGSNYSAILFAIAYNAPIIIEDCMVRGSRPYIYNGASVVGYTNQSATISRVYSDTTTYAYGANSSPVIYLKSGSISSNDVFYNIDATFGKIDYRATGVVTGDLNTEAIYTNFDFENVWIMGDNGPELRRAQEGSVSGTILDHNGDPAQRVVRLYTRADGILLAETNSDVTTGAYSFNRLPVGIEVCRVAVAEDDGQTLYNDIIDRVIVA